MVAEVVKDKRCPLCGGGLYEKTTTLPFVVKGSVVVVKGAAAEVCGDCGEAFLSGRVTDTVTALLRDAVSQGMEIVVVTLPEEVSSPA